MALLPRALWAWVAWVASFLTTRNVVAKGLGRSIDLSPLSRVREDDEEHSELARLRLENRALKRELSVEQELSELRSENQLLRMELSPLRTPEGESVVEASAPLERVFGLWSKSEAALTRELDRAFGGAGLFGGLARGAFSMAEPLVRSSSEDVEMVQRRVEALLEPVFGTDARVDTPFHQSYASSSINGQVTRSVAMFARASSPSTGKEGEIHVLATLDEDGITVDSLLLDGRKLRTSTPHDDPSVTAAASPLRVSNASSVVRGSERSESQPKKPGASETQHPTR